MMNKWIARTTSLVFFLVALCLLPAACEMKPVAQLDRFKVVEPLEFINQQNQTFSLGNLKGKVWVASFVFTSCNIECAYLVKRLQKVQDKVADDKNFSLISFSLDPQTDTPEHLTAYAKRYCGETRQWQFLTGDRGKLDRVINATFEAPNAGDRRKETPSEPNGPVHKNELAVVDKQGVIRFYVDGLLPNAEDLVLNAVQQLLAEPGS